MRQRIVVIILVIALLLPVLTTPALADMGPKPSVTVYLSGVEGPCYMTLLSEAESTGPYSARGTHWPPADDEEIWQKFRDYQDQDGFYFLEFLQNCTETNQFVWDYYPPERFKILIYFPELDSFMVSDEVYEQYAFDSCFDAEIVTSGEPRLEVQRRFNLVWNLAGFLIRLALTILVEVVIAVAMGFWGRQLLIILWANVATQLVLNIVFQLGGYQPMFWVYVMEYGLLEAGVLAAEAIVYSMTLPRYAGEKYGRANPVGYAVTANVVSFLVGYFVAKLFPFAF